MQSFFSIKDKIRIFIFCFTCLIALGGKLGAQAIDSGTFHTITKGKIADDLSIRIERKIKVDSLAPNSAVITITIHNNDISPASRNSLKNMMQKDSQLNSQRRTKPNAVVTTNG
jgi:hypothetical protein